VAQGFSQKYQVDYFDTYAPVVGLTTLRMLLSTATTHGWDIHQMDVETAFLNAPVAEVIYIKQAAGREVGANMVYRLKKSLYGLKQSPYNWNIAVHEWFLMFGLQCNSADGCLYSMTDVTTGKRLYLSLYVDDIIVTGDWSAKVTHFKSELQSRFKVKDLGFIEFCLGLHIKYDAAAREMEITQSHYIDQVLARFNLQNAAPVSTPAEKYIAQFDRDWHAQHGLVMGEAPVQ
jgi:hypothetical protein